MPLVKGPYTSKDYWNLSRIDHMHSRHIDNMAKIEYDVGH